MPDLPPLAAIRVFEAAARLENFSRAAEELGMTQAAVSYQVRQLEDRVGHPLFLREKGRVHLSEVGRRLAPAVSAALAGLAEAFAGVRHDDEGVLSLSALPSFGATWLSARIGRFQITYPDLALRLATTSRLVDFPAEAVDVAIRSGKGNWPGLSAEFLFQYHVTPVCAPAFIAAHGITRPADLLRVERLAPDDPWWAGWLASAGVDAIPAERSGIALDSQVEEAGVVRGGFGVALMTPMFWRDELASGQFVQPFPTLYLTGEAHWLVYPRHRSGTRKIARFREWLHGELALERARQPGPVWDWPPAKG